MKFKKAQYSIDFIKQISEDKGGRCISNEYVSDNEKLKFQCSKGHTWMATPIVVLQGGWCPQCTKLEEKNAKKQQRLEDIKQIAKERGGECLSDTYFDNKTKLLFQCSEGHQWEGLPANIKCNNTWCPHCAGNIKLNIEEIHKLAAKKGGKCLSKEYVNNGTKILWQCSEGHKWDATTGSIINSNSWCPYCAGTGRLTIDEMKEMAVSKGGKCLSKVYKNASTKLLWQCEEGHQWKATSGSIKNGGHWCPYCVGQIKLTIEQMQELAEKRGGKCLSKIYINNESKLLWQCSKGHQWEAKPMNIKHNNSWCPYCAGKNQTIEDMKTLAHKKDGKCLSKIYKGAHSKIKWQCKEGHIWESRPSNVKALDNWCPYCAGTAKLTIKEMYELAHSRGGKCLSDIFVNSASKLLWQCSVGHQWEAVPRDIKHNNSWCPICAKLKRKSK